MSSLVSPPRSSRKRVLFVAEGATLAHFVRPLVLADSLDTEQCEVHFYSPSRYAHYLQGKSFLTGELDTISGETFQANLARGAPLFPYDVLRRYVEEDRRILRAVQPDLVIGDLRFSLCVSARVESTPLAVVMSAYWSPYAERRYIVPEVPITRVIPARVLNHIYRFTEPLAHAVHVAGINRLRKEHGLPTFPPDIRVMYTDADYVLYPDVQELVPTPGAPRNHSYVGVCSWENVVPRPGWWENALSDPRPKVFLALGSSGPLRTVPHIVEACSRLNVALITATSGRTYSHLPVDSYSSDLLPYHDAAQLARVVISHGGSSGIYPALAQGTPVLAVPSNADQQLSAAVLAQSGAGLVVRSDEVSTARVFTALKRLLEDDTFSEKAEHWKIVIRRYDSASLFTEFMNGFRLP